MRVATHNINGIRAADRRGFRDWIDVSGADVVALQEMRCRPGDVPDGVFRGYHVAYNPGRLAGRNGVAVLTREAPASVFAWTPGADDVASWGPDGAPAAAAGTLFAQAAGPAVSVPPGQAGNPFLDEGRLVGVELADAPLTVVSVYVPKGGVPREIAPAKGREGYTPEQNHARYERKLDFLARLSGQLDALQDDADRAGRHLLVLGDYNIAHGPADVSNWRTNLGTEGFLPAERAWLDAAVGPEPSSGRLDGRRVVAPTMSWTPHRRPLVDVVRAVRPDEDGPYSWWSWRGQAFTNDVGWRIDYHLASPALAALATRAWVDRAVDYDHRVSDHAPVLVDYDL